MVIVGIVNYWLLIPTAIMSILFYIIRNVYVNSGRSLKRIEAMSKCLTLYSIQILLLLSTTTFITE